MIPTAGRSRQWMRSPRGLVIALGTTAALSAGALTWFTWEILKQERVVEEKRERDWLTNRADQVAQMLERAIGEATDALALTAGPVSPALQRLTTEGLVLTIDSLGVEPVPPGSLRFHPVVPARPEPRTSLFEDGETAEFRQNDRPRAIGMYRVLARSPDSGIRAAALMRLGGLQRNARQFEAARETFEVMASLGDVPVNELPAELVARDALWRVRLDLGHTDAARETAQRLYQDLLAGRWRLTRGQFEFYAAEAATASGIDAAADAPAIASSIAAADVWQMWQTQPPPRGRKAIRADGVPLLVVWNTTQDRMRAWIVEPSRLLTPLEQPAGVQVGMTEADGTPVAGDVDPSPMKVVRTPAETGLPWTLHVTGARTADASSFTRGKLVVGGLAVLLTFLGASAYFIGRAVKQEMDLARMQSGFVAAVSHEFRSPLAAIRQVSELLAAGRVPSEARRQQNYESLAAESQRLQRLVENLLDFSKLEAGVRTFRREPIDPRDLVEGVVEEFQSPMARPDAGCRIEIAGDTGSGQILGDAEALSLGLRNLLDNAVKYSRRVGTIHVSWAAEGDRIALRVRDEGPGIAPDEHARIFQRFVRGSTAETANVKGVGLGLAMVQHVVAGHGGEVTVSSEPGAGATFTMFLPAIRNGLAAGSSESQARSAKRIPG